MPQFTTRPEIIGTFGVAASTHWLASQTAMRMLEIGGNAFDAAVAGAFVLHVAEPHLNGPLGDVPILVHDASEDRQLVLCGQGPAPKAATIEAFERLGVRDVIPGNGLLAAAVPGAVDAWLMLAEELGSLDLATILEPAVTYASEGVPLAYRVCETIEAHKALFETHWPTSAAVFLPGGHVPRPGSLFRNEALGRTYRRLVDEAAGSRGRARQIRAARRAWSSGFVAEAVERWCRTATAMDQTGRENRALLTGADMAAWTAHFEDPIGYDYAGHRVLKCGPWSQGPVMLQTLALLKGVDLAGLDPVGADFVHLVVEAIKLAFADRDTFYGDPEGADVPLETLLGDDYSRERRRLIGREASHEYRPGTVAGHGYPVDYEAACARAALAAELAARGGGEPTLARAVADAGSAASGDTCYISVIDRDGNMVSAMPSGGWLPSSPVIPEIGMPLGTRLQMAWLDPRSPAALRPGGRPRTTLTPTMVLRGDGAPYLCLGTPGGDGQDQWQTICLLRHLHHGLNLQEAIDAPSFHSEHFPSSFYPRQAVPARLVIEDRFGAAVIAELARRGHVVQASDGWSEGRLCAASRSGDGTLRAGANPRGMQNYAVGR
jgi:gamma-glutamyltranspeptidase/glutathione hydrolase